MSAALQQKPEVKIKLTVVKGPHAGQVFQLSKDSFTLGRGPENNVVLLNDPQISRNHAQIKIVNQELEIINLSQKNAVVVDGTSVQKWKIINQSTFTLGDSEIQVEYDLGQAVVSVPTSKLADVVPLKIAETEPSSAPEAIQGSESPPKVNKPPTGLKSKKSSTPALKSQQVAQRPRSPQSFQQPSRPPVGYQQNTQAMPQANYDLNAQYRAQQAEREKNDSLMASPMFKFIMVGLILLGAAYSYLQTPTKKSQAKKIASTLKYEDEVNTRLYSKKEKELEEDRDYKFKMLNSPQSLRTNENFIRGMRDYQSGNYVRAQEFFQLVLNLDPDHALAKRHLYLSRIRFDEVLQAKLMLGESYYTKHNFRMCAAMYRQVLHMLEGKNNDQKYLLAEKKAKECDLASQGIR